MERKKQINSLIERINSSRIHAIFFKSKKIPFVEYWYEDKTSSLMTKYTSVSISYKTEEINMQVMDEVLEQLECTLIDYFKGKKGIILLPYDD